MTHHPLYVEEFGDPAAPDIVFLHAVGTTGWMWENQIQALKDDYHCIVPDLPGHGQSNAVRYQSTRHSASMIATVIEQYASDGKAHVVGLSLGAMVALDLLAQSPAQVDHAILSGVSVLPVPGTWMMRLAIPLMLMIMKTDFALKKNAEALRIPDAYFAQYKAAALSTKRSAFAGAMLDTANMHIPANVNDIHAPTLFVAGEDEMPLILQSIDLLADAFPNGQSAIASGGGHAWSIEMPDVFSMMIRAWIEDLPQPEPLQIQQCHRVVQPVDSNFSMQDTDAIAIPSTSA